MMAVGFALFACSTDSSTSDGPAGQTCEYSPVGSGTASYARLSAEQLGQFDHFVKVSVDEREHSTIGSVRENRVEVTEVVSGTLSEGDELALTSVTGICLEPGDDYYLLLNDGDNGSPEHLDNPWGQFPVINNRITLHQLMRKDELIGEFHGLDPVLFKRRFVEHVGRTDIPVD